MATEAKQTVNTVYQQYRTALRSKQIIFNLTDDQIEEMDLEVVLNTVYNNRKTQQVIKGTEEGISMLIMTLSKKEFEDEFTEIEVEDVNITL
ncbi:hypothetical protein YN120080_19 [Staphylococcus phage vB_SauM_JDYN]|nr:hypothetical protein YN120080_19 [Staphylococcus phage vB_SauM_JDYN]